MRLSILQDRYAVCRLSSGEGIPAWVNRERFWSVTKTDGEISVVCLERDLPTDLKVESGWKIIKVEGPLDFGLTGIFASIANPLAAAKVSIFALSTFDTDYILVKEECLSVAQLALENHGFHFCS